MKITAETPIQISLRAALAGACTLAILTVSGTVYVASQVSDDVAAARTDIHDLRQAAREDAQIRESGDASLRQGIADLTAQLRVTTNELANVTDGLTLLSNSIDTIDAKLTASLDRQQEFEKSIVARLDGPGFGGFEIPASWSMGQAAIITSIKSGDDPLGNWFKGLPPPKQ